MPKVSIVVPVYNVENYIRRCIDSIINQTLKDIEIICVDDGSTDSCPAILDEYARSDSRVKVIHKQNGGYGIAMNVGMAAASGKYTGIVESDDYILPDMYETLYSEAEKYDLDMVKSDFTKVWLDRSESAHRENMDEYYNKPLDCRKLRKVCFHFLMFNWTGIYKTSFLRQNNIKHNETPGASYQDTAFWLQTISMCERAMWLDKEFYMYWQENPSSSFRRKDKVMAYVREYDFAENILKNKGLYEELSICHYYRLDIQRYNFNRIGVEYKKEFADVVIDEYERFKDDMVCYDDKAAANLIDWMENLKKNKDAICDKMIKDHKLIKDKINAHSEFILYGTGNVARKRYYTLKMYDLDKKIKYFVVSGEPEENNFMGHSVFKFENVADTIKNDLVIICVSAKNEKIYSEIENKLRSSGIENYVSGSLVELL